LYEIASITSSLVTFVTHVITDLGMPGLFVLLVAGSCGIPISSEAVMLFAGYDVYRGHFSLAEIIVVAIVADLTGSSIAYAIGYFGRIELIRHHGAKIHLTPERLERAERWFARYGAAAIPISRMLPLVRAYTSFPAGAARLPYPRFLVLSCAGGLPWMAAWGILGYELGPSYHSVQNHLHYVDYAGIALIAAIIIYVIWRWRRGSRQGGALVD
jgi:membrane protein DedA with SNARE-associated domain